MCPWNSIFFKQTQSQTLWSCTFSRFFCQASPNKIANCACIPMIIILVGTRFSRLPRRSTASATRCHIHSRDFRLLGKYFRFSMGGKDLNYTFFQNHTFVAWPSSAATVTQPRHYSWPWGLQNPHGQRKLFHFKLNYFSTYEYIFFHTFNCTLTEHFPIQ